MKSNSVAIDNKIEQAMDLVKSHLMFAVRQEVDVLKDTIVGLMERIQSLETENAILRQQTGQTNATTQSLLSSINISQPISPIDKDPVTLEEGNNNNLVEDVPSSSSSPETAAVL